MNKKYILLKKKPQKQNIMERDELEYFLGTQMAFWYNGSDLPGKQKDFREISGTIISVDEKKFKIEFNNGDVHELTNKHINIKTPAF